jgi:hypothetical protein
MQAAAQALIGEHDFTSFRAAQCQAHTPVKQMLRIDMDRRGAYWRFEFEANAFLHHMIRNIMGCLVYIGTGARPAQLDGRGAGRTQPRRRSAHVLTRRPLFPGPGLRSGSGSSRPEPPLSTGCHEPAPHTHQDLWPDTRADVDAAAHAGADAIGFVLYPKSPRFVSPELRR